MDTRLEMITAVQSDLTVGSGATLYSPTAIKLALDRAYNKAAALFPWPGLMDAKKTTAEDENEYYDYPAAWRSNSIWKLVVDDERYGEDPDGSPLSFDDYLNWEEDYPNSTDKKWSNQERRFFLTPTPTDGVEICIWGKMIHTAMTVDGSTTIFSYHMPEGNEAIVLEAVGILKAKGENEQSTLFKSTEAKQLLSIAWGKIIKEMSKYEKNQPFFDVPNFFSDTSTADLRGKFNTRV